ncbi:MAG: hypothetical protein K8T20_21060 [Planctomycetes bacterium]|nr:hypothetical protein [Planctomycetota bacterium]
MTTLSRRLAAMAAAFALLAPVAGFAEPEPPAPAKKEVAATPEDAAKQFEAALKGKNRARAWELIGSESRKVLEEKIGEAMKAAEGEERTELAEELGVSEADYATMSAKDLVLATLFAKFSAQNSKKEMSLTIKDVKVEGGKAEAKTAFGDEEPTTSHFIKEDGEWKFDVKRDMDESGKAPPPDAPPDPDNEDSGEGDGK